jgi:3',5'-cyclic AMP phosphodiesterase CpdA
MNFIHISDLHLKGNDKENEAALKLLDFIKKNYPDHNLIISGDITDDGGVNECEQALAALAPFKGHIFLCPGNHDFGREGNFFSQERAERFDRRLSNPLGTIGPFAGDNTPIVKLLKDDAAKVVLMALDTNLETTNVDDFACGKVGERQLTFLQKLLAYPQYAEHTKILFFHHHPFIHSQKTMLKDADELLNIIKQKVDIVCFGHEHVSGIWRDRDGVKYFLAADKSPDSGRFREIKLTGQTITVTDKKTPWAQD